MRVSAFREERLNVVAVVRILLADDHAVVRRMLRQLLEEAPGCTVCGEASDGAEAVRLTAELVPDVAVLDLGMPRLSGLEAAQCIRTASPRTMVLMVTLYETEDMVREALLAGACAYLLKRDAPQHLVPAVLALAHGDCPYFTPQLTPDLWHAYASAARASHP